MTKEEIKAGNRLLAEFVGHYFPGSSILDYIGRPLSNYHYAKIRYHRDWNLLMRAVQKIESMHDDFHGYFGVYISSNRCCIQGTKLRTDPEHFHPAYFNDITLETKIESTWYAVTMFIQWHNQNKDK